MIPRLCNLFVVIHVSILFTETPQNTDATKPVKPNSFIALVCNSQNAELLSDSAKNPLVAAAFSNLPKLVPFLKGGYFAVKQNTKELNETCFEPMKLLTIAELDKLYPGFRSAKPMPFFTMPADTEHVTGIKVNLRADKALYGGNVANFLTFLSSYLFSSIIRTWNISKGSQA